MSERIRISNFKKQTGLRGLFDKSNHKLISGFFGYDEGEGQALDSDGALRPSYPLEVFATTSEVNGTPAFILNDSSISTPQSDTSIALFLSNDGYLYDVNYDGTITRTAAPTPYPKFTPVIDSSISAELHLGQLFIHPSNEPDSRFLWYTKSSSGAYIFEKTTGLIIPRGRQFIKSFRDMIIIVPTTFTGSADGSVISVQKMTVTKEVKAGFTIPGPQLVKHVDSINTDYFLIFTDKKYSLTDTDKKPNDGLLCYLWNGEATTWTRLLHMPYRGIIGTCKIGGLHYAFTYDDKNVYALEWDGRAYNEKARTSFSFIKNEIAKVAYNDGNFIFFFPKQMNIVYWNITTGTCSEVQNLGLTSGVTSGFMSPDGLWIFAAATGDPDVQNQTGRIIRLNPSKQLPSDGVVTKTPFFDNIKQRYESNVLVPPVNDRSRMGALKINHLIIEGEKLDELGADSIEIKLFTRDEENYLFVNTHTSVISSASTNIGVKKTLAKTYDIGVMATSFYITVEHKRTSPTKIWNGEIKSIIVDYDIINVEE